MSEKISLNDSIQDVIFKLSGGNPGAISVLSQVYQNAYNIDTFTSLGSLAYYLQLDSLGIRGSMIWILYKDICKENILHFMAVIRAVQMGIVAHSDLTTAVLEASQGIRNSSIDSADALAKLRTKLPGYGVDFEEKLQG